MFIILYVLEKVMKKLLYSIIFLPLGIEYLEAWRLPYSFYEALTEIILGIVLGILIYCIFYYQKKIENLIREDTLTSFFNNKTFWEDLEKEAARAKRYKIPLALASVEVTTKSKKFAAKNMDHIISQVALQIQNTLRQNVDLCYRVEENRFAIFLPSTKADPAKIVFDRIKLSVNKALTKLYDEKITLAVGVVELEEEETFKRFVDRANKSMHLDKVQTKQVG